MGLINQLNSIGGGGTTIIRRGYDGTVKDMEPYGSPSEAGAPNHELSGTTWFMSNVSLNTSVTINVSTKDTNAKDYEANSTTWTLT